MRHRKARCAERCSSDEGPLGRKLGLTRADVVNTAVALADAEGLDAVTLASVAARLGIRSPSLYAHVDGLDGLRRLLALEAAAAFAAEIEGAVEGHEGRTALRRTMFAYRGFAQRHPGLYQAAQRAVKPGEDDELYQALAAVVLPVFRTLAEVGVGPEDQVHITRAIRSALHGFVVLEHGGGFGMPESVDESYTRLVELLISAVTAHDTTAE
jgi:AcrR family transcriptional regulator